MSLLSLYFKSLFSFNTFISSTHPLSSLAICNVFGKASGSNAIRTLLNLERNSLCPSSKLVPSKATPVQFSWALPTT